MQKYLNQQSDIDAQEKYFDKIISSYKQNEIEAIGESRGKKVIKHRLYNANLEDDFQNKYPVYAFIDNNYGSLTQSDCRLQSGTAVWYGNKIANIAYCGNGILDWQEKFRLDKKSIFNKRDLIPQLHSIETTRFSENHIKDILLIIAHGLKKDPHVYTESKLNAINSKYFNSSLENSCLLPSSQDVFPENIIIEKNISNKDLNTILTELFIYEKVNLTGMESTLSGKIEKVKNILPQDFISISSKVKKISYTKLLFFQSSKLLFGLFSIMLALLIVSFYYFRYKENQPIYALKIFFSCILLVIIGYSTYGVIFIRAGQSPRINENTPDNLERALAYINRDQYGAVESFNPSSAIRNSNSGHWKRWAKIKESPTFKEKRDFIWNYQIK